MPSSYSLDLRKRVVAVVGAGYPRRSAGRHFGVSESFAIRLVRQVRASGSLVPGWQVLPNGSGKLEPHAAFLIGTVEARPNITMPELIALLLEARGVTAAAAMLSRWLCRRGFTYKENSGGLRVRTLRRERSAILVAGTPAAFDAAPAPSPRVQPALSLSKRRDRRHDHNGASARPLASR